MEDSYDYEDNQRRQRLGFWLLPFNKAAAALVSCHPWNLERFAFDKDTSALWIDFSNPDKQEYTVGCSDSVDIYLPQVWNSTGSSGISELHASFRAVTDTGPILLCDESEYSSTEPFSHGTRSYTVNFRPNAERSVLVAQGTNSLVAFGHGRFYQFELRWENDGLGQFRMKPPVLYALGPSRVKAKRYVLGDKVGGGTFGNVYRALDVTTGSIMAVKKFHRLSGKRLDFASREITNLLKLNSDETTRCDHIIQIFDYTTGSDWTEIFLPLKQGNLKTLVQKILPPSSYFEISNLVLNQMLLALHHLEQHHIIHRDLNPENILFEPSPSTGTYHFTLADFGLSTSTTSTTTTTKSDRIWPSRPEIAGTIPFMAPEIYTKPPQKQTCKIDIWSLFATVVWVRDAKFRKGCELLGPHLVHVWLNRIAGREGEGKGGRGYKGIRRMACFDPGRRPSAGEMLEILEMEAEMEAEMDEWEGLEARFAGMGLEWDARRAFAADDWDRYATPETPHYRYEEPYMTGAIGDYRWNGASEAWSDEGYVFPMEALRGQEGWTQDYDGHFDLSKAPRDEGAAALARWTAWYHATDRQLLTEDG
ncbi:kinase-like domain-containing protein [Pseudoneurospora amorphoporcata]|uniref:non-specific serine/threonine protein kinase n=1 Tax=Pseudoneurospora amorphoporcata TaxID=241081 RepID=A0AAN6NVU1_9PEZI|nr:kinase-like domain-containing protein [Pseudoneurospora amorphoporcata]